MEFKKMRKFNLGKKASGLLNIFVVIVLSVMLFISLNTFLVDNVVRSGRDPNNDPVMANITESQTKLTATKDSMEEISNEMSGDIEGISESNILIAGLYVAAGVLSVFKLMFKSVQYMTGGMNAMIAPLAPAVPEIAWFVGGLVVVLTIYILFKMLEAISGRTNI